MHEFRYKRGKLVAEELKVEDLAAEYGTPLYLYSDTTVRQNYRRLADALSGLDAQICFAMKANSNKAILAAIVEEGGGFDTVSSGEIQRAIAAGGNPAKMVFAGVGKGDGEIEFGLKKGIYSFNVESEAELRRIEKVAKRLGKRAPVAIRVNPNVDADTHAKITTGTYENKFGIAFEEIERLYAVIAKKKYLQAKGLQMHIGSQLTSVKPFKQATEKVAPLAARLKAQYGIEFLSIGGGIGIVYDQALASGEAQWWTKGPGKKVMTPAKYAKALTGTLKKLDLKILVEPGRFIVGNAGILVTKVEYTKHTGHKRFVIVDAAMNDLIRPAMYEAFHEILPTKQSKAKPSPADVVGPICETGDRFCQNRPLPHLKEGDFLAIMSAGAYGFVMAGTYNSRGLPAEVMVRGNQASLVRKRQPVRSIWKDESIPNWR